MGKRRRRVSTLLVIYEIFSNQTDIRHKILIKLNKHIFKHIDIIVTKLTILAQDVLLFRVSASSLYTRAIRKIINMEWNINDLNPKFFGLLHEPAHVWKWMCAMCAQKCAVCSNVGWT